MKNVTRSAPDSSSQYPPIVVITGHTGSGKSALALLLATDFNGEIISADSRTVYRGMDIGTAKPTLSEQAAIMHYGLDVVEPGQQFTAAEFKKLAEESIAAIASKGKLPFVVGGTGLYIDALIYDYNFRPLPEPAFRSMYARMTVNELREQVINAGLPLPQNGMNPRHLSRLLESGPPPLQPKILRPNTLLLGLHIPMNELKDRIYERVDAMVRAGLVEEVRALYSSYGTIEALRAPGYRAFLEYISGVCRLEQAKEKFIRNDLLLAKRQNTWFKRNKAIHWLSADNKHREAASLVKTFLDTLDA